MTPLDQAIGSLLPHLIAFCQRLIQTPSLPGREGDMAGLVRREMQNLGYDEARIDGAGNVIGLMRGDDPAAPKVMFNAHLDHVDPGDLALWRHPPYSGAIVEEKIYGRGAADIKGPLAVQVYVPAVLRKAGLRPRGDVYVTAVVLEEVGGTGMRYLVEQERLPVDCVVLGEATGNDIMLGHRGKIPLWMTFHGRAGHASAPERAVNPHYAAAEFLLRLRDELPQWRRHSILGASTIAPTLYHTDSTSNNVIPDTVRLFLDWRTTGETEDEAVEWLRRLVAELGIAVDIEVEAHHHVTYTGYDAGVHKGVLESFITPMQDAFVIKMAKVVQETLGREPKLGIWQFATDGWYTARLGIPTFGFSPAEEPVVHTVDEYIRIAMMVDALRCQARFLGEPFL